VYSAVRVVTYIIYIKFYLLTLSFFTFYFDGRMFNTPNTRDSYNVVYTSLYTGSCRDHFTTVVSQRGAGQFNVKLTKRMMQLQCSLINVSVLFFSLNLEL